MSWRLRLISILVESACSAFPQLTEEDVDAHEGDCCSLCFQILRAGYSPCDGNDELADTHADGAHQKQIAAPNLLDQVQARERGHNINRTIRQLASHQHECHTVNTYFVITWMMKGF